jgi:hypothetical protein
LNWPRSAATAILDSRFSPFFIPQIKQRRQKNSTGLVQIVAARAFDLDLTRWWPFQ